MLGFIDSCILFVKSLLVFWPKESNAEIEVCLKSISDSISENFDKTDLVVGFSGFGELVKTVISSANTVIIEFNDIQGHPYRAQVVKDQNNKLLLEYVRFQCPVCFGSGVNEDQECMICRGKGWGAD